MKATISIKEVSSGRIVSFTEDWDNTQRFLYELGNYSCDCNRKIVFYAQLEGRELEDEETPCTDGKYLVRAILDDGTVDVDEFTV